MSLFRNFLLVLMLVYLVHGQRNRRPPPIPRNVRIPWSGVTGSSVKTVWTGNINRCNTYNLVVMAGYSKTILFTYTDITGQEFTAEGLQPGTIYGTKVQCVTNQGTASEYSVPARTITMGTTTTEASTTPPRGLVPVGSCGEGFYTCDETSCIPESWWCNGIKECHADTKGHTNYGHDERNCPGSCEEITEFHANGNFSCSVYNSHLSSCFFDCSDDFVRNGPWYTVCLFGQWTRDVPSCQLKAPSVFVENDQTARRAIVFVFTGLKMAGGYLLTSIVEEVSRGETVDTAYDEFLWEDEDGVIVGRVTGLRPGRTYLVTVAGYNENNEPGMPSNPTRARTAP